MARGVYLSRAVNVTVAILAQGTSWAVAVTQAYFAATPQIYRAAVRWAFGRFRAVVALTVRTGTPSKPEVGVRRDDRRCMTRRPTQLRPLLN